MRKFTFVFAPLSPAYFLMEMNPYVFVLTPRRHPNSYVEILASKVMILRRVAFGTGLGHEGRVLMNRISALTKSSLRKLSCPFHCVRTQLEGPTSEPGSGLLPDTKSPAP